MKIDKNIKILWAIIIIITSVLVIIIAFVQYAKAKMKKIMSKNNFTNPTAQKFRISSSFGNRIAPIPGASTYHNGIDVACPTGTPILSVADGVVDNVWNDTNGGGLSIRIKHNDGYQTGYAHLSRQDVTAGQSVQKGKQIALSGNTGNSSGAHLHFTLKYNGVAINPLNYFYK